MKKPILLLFILLFASSLKAQVKPDTIQPIAYDSVTVLGESVSVHGNDYALLPCPICGAKGYLHKAINGEVWCVDCTMYDKAGYEWHERVGNYWYDTKQDAVRAWNERY